MQPNDSVVEKSRLYAMRLACFQQVNVLVSLRMCVYTLVHINTIKRTSPSDEATTLRLRGDVYALKIHTPSEDGEKRQQYCLHKKQLL